MERGQSGSRRRVGMISMMIAKRRTKMRTKKWWPKFGLFLMTLFFLSAIPLTAEALEVKFCVPNCATDPTPDAANKGPGTPVINVNGVPTNTLTIASFVYKGFTISGTVVAQQSGTLQKITFNPTTITANATAGCTTAASNPCQIEIIATSEASACPALPALATVPPPQRCDFPAPKPTGGYPAGVVMIGKFTGTPATGTGNGDTISMTAEASGLQADNITPINSDVINATPGASSGDVLVSLPSSCTGSATCKFTATSLVKSFNTQITETVQQQCDTGLTQCLTRLRTKININIKKSTATDIHKVDLPTDFVHVDSEEAAANNINPAQLLITTIGAPFDIDVQHLLIYRNNFALDGRFTLDQNTTIDPSTEEVYLNIGGKFALTIPPGMFKKSLQGRLFTMLGKVDGLAVAASFSRGSNPLGPWLFAAAVNGVSLKPVLVSPTTQVELGVGSDHGRDNIVTAAIFQ
jgi:hypothetical protein